MHSGSMVNSMCHWCSMFYSMHCRSMMNSMCHGCRVSYRGRVNRGSMMNSMSYRGRMSYRGMMNRGSVVNSMSYRGMMNRGYRVSWLRLGRMRGFGISMSIDKFLTNLFWQGEFNGVTVRCS